MNNQQFPTPSSLPLKLAYLLLSASGLGFISLTTSAPALAAATLGQSKHVSLITFPPDTAPASQFNPRISQNSSGRLPVGSLSELKGDQTCQGTGGIMTYAETAKYRVYICADEKNRSQPRYYRSRDKQNKTKLDLKAEGYDPRKPRHFEFKNKGYTYILQIPQATVPNPLLVVEFPGGKRVTESVVRYLAVSK